MPRVPLHEFTYLLGRGSLVEARKILESSIAKEAQIAVYLDRLSPHLFREIMRWKRKMLLAELRGEDPREVNPPATLRAALLEAYIESKRKLVVSDSQISFEAEGEESDEEED